MKIGKLEFKEYAARKPVLVTPSGSFMSVKEAFTTSFFETGSLLSLSTEAQKQLALRRYLMEPDFRLGVFNLGIFSKSDILDHIKGDTDLGRLIVKVEMQYCNEMMTSLRASRLPGYPKVPHNPVPEQPEWKEISKTLYFKLKTTALFAENTTDQVTRIFADYRAANVHPAFTAKGFQVVVNKGTQDTRINFVKTARKPLTVYMSGIGHGNWDVYTGHAGDFILEAGYYDAAEVTGKAIHFLSCRTAAELGPDTISQGALCYAGYNENFTFVLDDPETPVNEADLFKKCDSTFDIFMAHGSTARQAHEASVASFNASIAQVPGTVAASWLSYDRDHFVLHGDPDTAILPYRFAKVSLPLRKPEQADMLAAVGELV